MDGSLRSWLFPLLPTAVLAAAVLVSAAAHGQVTMGEQGGQRELVPRSFELNPAVRAAIDAEWLTDAERSELRVFHGAATPEDLTTPRLRAMDALDAWRFDDPALQDETVPIELRAEALVLRGELRRAVELLRGAPSITAARLRAEAYEGLGDYERAGRALEPLVRRLQQDLLESAADLTEGVRALAIRARIEGQPGRDYQSMMKLLARSRQELDRMYWPSYLAEAELLLDKHNRQEGIQALHEAMSLNPRSARGWYMLGRIALRGFVFGGAQNAVVSLRRLDAHHPLADLLHAESRLVQNDPAEARDILVALTERMPRLRPAHALLAAAGALLFDEAVTKAALTRYDELSPGSAEAYYTAGRHLSMFRQYDEAAAMLEEAIRRQPLWATPRLELGLMEMQTGRDVKALSVLRELVALDPFNKRSANSLALLEQLAEYAEIKTDHFIIRYLPGVDEVLVDMMPAALERIHARVAPRFGWEPEQKTIIEVMPDHKRFAVRITGMPTVHTIAACTGPIIAMEVPRSGAPAEHLGTFDWERVLQHEYTHTVTLDMTSNRIPHWFTEALAVHMEDAPRDYSDCVMLADSWKAGTLFDLDEIKWAFVRPRRPSDRGKAYTQGHWMVEFIEERFGNEAIMALLGCYDTGEREEQAIEVAFGVTREVFFQDFLAWAGEQVEAWGLAPKPTLIELTDELRWADPELALVMEASTQARLDAIVKTMMDRIGKPALPGDTPFTADRWPELLRPPVEIDDDQLVEWRQAYPDHPELLREEIMRRIAARGRPHESLVPRLERLAELRPIDIFAHQKLAQTYLASDDKARAIPHLEALDAREEKSSIFARQLATLYREAGDYDRALAMASRTVSIAPYVAETRELAAAIAVQSGDLKTARQHVLALTLLEPDRPQHRRRLARLDAMLAP